MEHEYGLALSGGAARAAAHLGILQAMNEANISPSRISCTSAGAMVACFYAEGYEPAEVLEIIEKEPPFKKITLRLPHKGLFKLDKLMKWLSKYIKTSSIEAFGLPVHIGVTDFLEGKLRYLEKGSVTQALKATSAVPGFFDPVEINGSLCYDGGLISNLPVEPLEKTCDKIIGCNINPVEPVDHLGTMKELAVRTVLIGINANVQANIPKCDIYIEPEKLVAYGLTDNSHYRQMYEIGYQKAKEIFASSRSAV